MANFKRKKSRRNVKCTMCTPFRLGNAKGRTQAKYQMKGMFNEANA